MPRDISFITANHDQALLFIKSFFVAFINSFLFFLFGESFSNPLYSLAFKIFNGFNDAMDTNQITTDAIYPLMFTTGLSSLWCRIIVLQCIVFHCVIALHCIISHCFRLFVLLHCIVPKQSIYLLNMA